MPAERGALAGLGVLVTRPQHQADSLCEQIARHGGTPFRFPVLEILAPLDAGPLQAVVARLERYAWALFVSANAVERALDAILAVRDWPQNTRIAVIGRSSARALQRYGLTADLVPTHRYDSEALLELAAMQQVSGQRCVIFRGEGGREYLAETLRQRGAEVDYVAAYRRGLPSADPAPLLAHWRAGDIDIAMVTSADGLKNLLRLIGAEGALLWRRTPLLVVSERLVPLAGQMGLESPPLVAINATDDAVLQALLAWRQGQQT